MIKTRREVLTYGGAAGTVVLAGCTGGGGDGETPTPQVRRETVVRERTVIKERTPKPQELTPMKTLESEGSIGIPIYLWGIQHGAWQDHGIDLSMEVTSFGKFQRQVVAGLSNIGSQSVPSIVTFVNNGEDLTTPGTKLNMIMHMLAKSDRDDIQDPTDLAGKRLGVPFLTSTGTNVHRAVIMNEYDFDILEDTGETRSSPPPVLWNLLMDDEVDAIIEFSGFTVRAAATDDVKTVFSPGQYWRETYGHSVPVSSWASRLSWLEGNADLALRFFAGWRDAVEMFAENIDVALRNYGRLGGVASDAEATVIKDWMADDIIVGPFEQTQELADNTWRLIEMLGEIGAVEALPDKGDALTTHDELREWAGTS